MSVWNNILQATHSALIDELNDRFPDEKLELGLPKRFEGFAALDEKAEILLWETRSDSEGSGFTALSGLELQPTLELSDVFTKTRARAEVEFKKRNIGATYGISLTNAPKTRMTIWLPISIRRAKDARNFDLGLGLGA
jgi:hypothetical protein